VSTYQPIASQTLSSAAASVTFSGIPQTYTDLVVVINGSMSASGATIYARLNGDTGSNYSVTYIGGNGTSAYSNRSSNNSNGIGLGGFEAGFSTGMFTNIVHFQNYSNSTTNKTVLSRWSDPSSGGEVEAFVGLWRNTTAITSIEIRNNGGHNFNSGSTFNLYGIDASLSAQAKATGGTSIYTDGTYWYHIFNTSGTFTPTQALTCDYLVVAGGGGGGKNWAGGGGAGGYRYLTSQSVTAQAYTVTVGGGGAGATTLTALNSGSNSSFNSTSATGGGAGGNNQASPASGGSGGGGAYTGEAGVSTNGAAGNAGSYSPVEGYAGGNGYNGSTRNSSAGGGGSSAVGANAVNDAAGAGGAGTSNSITGSAVTYAGGGGGGGFTPTGTYPAGAGGSGGGGAGGQGNGTTGTAGTANTGGGGGGGAGGNGNGGAGGSGIIVIRYSAA